MMRHGRARRLIHTALVGRGTSASRNSSAPTRMMDGPAGNRVMRDTTMPATLLMTPMAILEEP